MGRHDWEVSLTLALSNLLVPKKRVQHKTPGGWHLRMVYSTSGRRRHDFRARACFMGRRTTGWLPRSLLPSMTSSLASTVPSAGHQLTGTSAWYASPRRKSCRKIHCVQR